MPIIDQHKYCLNDICPKISCQSQYGPYNSWGLPVVNKRGIQDIPLSKLRFGKRALSD